MSEPKKDLVQPPEQAAETGTVAARISLSQRAGGIAVPVATVILAFLVGGLVVLATGHNPLNAYRDIFNGGLNWIFHPTTNTQGPPPTTLPDSSSRRRSSSRARRRIRLPLRMFNIGGQGQYFVGCCRELFGVLRWHEHVADVLIASSARPFADMGASPGAEGDDGRTR